MTLTCVTITKEESEKGGWTKEQNCRRSVEETRNASTVESRVRFPAPALTTPARRNPDQEAMPGLSPG